VVDWLKSSISYYLSVLTVLSIIITMIYKLLRRRSSSIIKSITSNLSTAIVEHLRISTNRVFVTRLVFRSHAYLALEGSSKTILVPGRHEKILPIDDCYVPLTFTTEGDHRSHTHGSVLNLGRRIRIIGDPGSGKSTLLQKLYREACTNAARQPSKSQLPIRLDLHRLSVPKTVTSDGLGEFFLRRLREAAIPPRQISMIACFDAIARTNGLLVLLDGLDQVSAGEYPRIEAAVLQLSELLSALSEKNQILITMRYQFYLITETNLQKSFPVVVSLNPFTPTDLYLFLKRWPFSEDPDGNVTRIFDDLTDRPNLRQMCTSPLVLAMYVAEDQAPGYNPIPDSRTAFYVLVVRELLIRRQERQIGQRKGRVGGAVLDQREKILGEIAFAHLTDPAQPGNWIDWDMCLAIVKRHLVCDERAAADKIREISIETGIINEERTEEKISFIHLTFCEFMAAHYTSLQTDAGWESLLETHRNFQSTQSTKMRLGNVIPFAAGLLVAYRKDVAIGQILDLDIETQIQVFLETKQYEHPVWVTLISRFERELTDSLHTASGSDADLQRIGSDWSHRVYALLVAMEDAHEIAKALKKPTPTVQPVEFIRGILEHTNASTTMILALAVQDAVAALRLSDRFGINMLVDLPAMIVLNSDQPAFFAVILERAREARDETDVAAWTTLIAEAALYSSAVAIRLMGGPELPNWQQSVAQLRPAEKWFRPPRIARTALTELLSVGRKTALGGIRDRPLLSLFSRIPTVGRGALFGLMYEKRGSDRAGVTFWLFAIIGLANSVAAWMLLSLFNISIMSIITVEIIELTVVIFLTRLGQPDGISPSRMAEMLEVDKAGPKVRC
jgi:hypothetical protein